MNEVMSKDMRPRAFATCTACGLEMNGQGCEITHLEFENGETHQRIPFQPDEFMGDASDIHCGDCNTHPGGYHHLGCDMEECPRCHGQLLSCECGED